ncbi:MAG: hypothetical protein PUP92_34475 [Rhizonema sp. PD38]|nr:hypothetical protein [Rhizonema sp. PD38]
MYLPTVIFLELVLQNFGPYSGRQVINLDPRENSDRPVHEFIENWDSQPIMSDKLALIPSSKSKWY